MQHSTLGIVLGVTRYKDNACIATIYTQQFGKISYAVHNPQSKRAKVRMQHLAPMTLLELEVTHRENKDIQSINEAKLHALSYSLHDDPIKNTLCFFMAEVVQKSLETKNADTELFAFLVHCLQQLVAEKALGWFALSFLLEYAKYLGIYPYDEEENEWIKYLPADDKKLFLTLLQNPQPLQQAQKRRLMQLVIAYYQHFLPGMGNLKSLSVLTEIFGA